LAPGFCWNFAEKEDIFLLELQVHRIKTEHTGNHLTTMTDQPRLRLKSEEQKSESKGEDRYLTVLLECLGLLFILVNIFFTF
jgi:hypothetical protein